MAQQSSCRASEATAVAASARGSGEAGSAAAPSGALPRVDHVGIVVPDLTAAAALYRELGCDVMMPVALPGQGIAKVYVRFANVTIELIAPTTARSPIRHLLEDQNATDFLARRPGGGLHHVCFLVADLNAMQDELVAEGRRMLGTGATTAGSPDRAIAWLDPAGADGVLIELKQGVDDGRDVPAV